MKRACKCLKNSWFLSSVLVTENSPASYSNLVNDMLFLSLSSLLLLLSSSGFGTYFSFDTLRNTSSSVGTEIP